MFFGSGRGLLGVQFPLCQHSELLGRILLLLECCLLLSWLLVDLANVLPPKLLRSLFLDHKLLAPLSLHLELPNNASPCV